MSDARRVAEVWVAGDTLHHLFTVGDKGAYRVVRGLPPDAELVGVEYEMRVHRLRLLFRSAEFRAVPAGCVPPVVDMGYEWGADGEPPVGAR